MKKIISTLAALAISAVAFTFTVSAATLPATPYVYAKTESATEISVQWSKVDGAEKYNVYEWKPDKPGLPVYQPSTGKYILSRTVKASDINPDAGKQESEYKAVLKYTKDTKNVPHIYKVAAVDVTGSKTTVGTLSNYTAAFTANTGKVTLADVKGRYNEGEQGFYTFQIDPAANEIWIQGSNDYYSGLPYEFIKYQHGKYTAAIKSDTEVELRTVKSDDIDEYRIVFDKSKNAVSVWGENGAFDRPYTLVPVIPNGVN